MVFSPDVALYFFNWFSVFGIIAVAYNTLTGAWTLTLLAAMNMVLLALTYGIFLLALRMFGERFTWKDLIAFIFMFPYWLIGLFVQSLSNIEWSRKSGDNWWRK